MLAHIGGICVLSEPALSQLSAFCRAKPTLPKLGLCVSDGAQALICILAHMQQLPGATCSLLESPTAVADGYTGFQRDG
jgi:hypothetical protein